MIKMHRDQIQKIKADLDQPGEHQAQDVILSKNKFAIIFANENYSNENIGMIDLPEVNDDFKNIFQTVKMMNIPDENIFAEKNIKS